jgi:drug/metabolite transporter (DMT)-like permease
VLSLGAVSLLMLLIRRGAITRTTSLFYLVPPVTVLWAWLWFDEEVGALALVGIALAAGGVALVQRGGAPPARRSDGGERPREIGPQVVDVLAADAEAKQGLRDLR